jgi:hypothetical protein
MVEWWNDGMVEWWSGGVVEWWSGGMVKRWNGGLVESWNRVVHRGPALIHVGRAQRATSLRRVACLKSRRRNMLAERSEWARRGATIDQTRVTIDRT